MLIVVPSGCALLIMLPPTHDSICTMWLVSYFSMPCVYHINFPCLIYDTFMCLLSHDESIDFYGTMLSVFLPHCYQDIVLSHENHPSTVIQLSHVHHLILTSDVLFSTPASETLLKLQ